MNEIEKKLEQSLKTSFFDESIESTEEYRPKLIVNNYKRGTKVIKSLSKELNSCVEFYFSVAFITNSGINILLHDLRELEKRGIKGKIITTNYLNFNEPSALRRLLKFSNIEIRIFDNGNFHAKGYIFKKENSYSLIIGSSNLTQEALTKNEEWNLRITSLENGELLRDTLKEFNDNWNNSIALTEDWIDKYEKEYSQSKALTPEKMRELIQPQNLTPNKMQVEALSNLKQLRENNRNKALLISATGTGKTYLSAFDVQSFNPTKMLFIVHREQIARDALKSFRKIFGNAKTLGLISGSHKDFGAGFIFATMQTMSKPEILNKIAPDHFNYIIIDEVHRAGAPSYQRILQHFKPDFMLGMTATPERNDGYDIYKLFDYNIAYEIRLQKALEEDMLCPFHYFGVSEIEVDGKVLDDYASFNQLTSEERVKNITKNIEFYGSSGSRVKGLVFCSRTDEATKLSEIFNNIGYRTLALTGSNTQEERENAVQRLEQDENNTDALDYIFTVDIFNEGVDIPSINQIVMLRPTESAIIFVQQLGRGLRKYRNKDYVVIIDFIGNYERNFWIPIALSGDHTYDADAMRKYISEGTCIIPGCSTIMFDKVAEQRIYESINHTNFSQIKFIKNGYDQLKIKLGKIPTLLDFYKYGSISPQLIFEKAGTYHNFLIKNEPAYKISLSSRQQDILGFVSQEFSNPKRPQEVLILKRLIENGHILKEDLSDIPGTIGGVKSVIKILSGGFHTENTIKKFNNLRFITTEDNAIILTKEISNCLTNEFRLMLLDVLDYAEHNYKDNYSDTYLNTDFCLYQKYTRKDVCRLLNWGKNEESTIYGYRIKHNTCPIFVTYKKGEDIVASIKYEDEFVDREIFSWMTRNNVTLNSTEAVTIQNYKANNLTIHLFVKKDDDEGTGFYYLGKAKPISAKEATIKDKHNRNLPIVNFKLKLETPTREDIYDYLLK